MEKTLYFGHPINVYGTPLKRMLMDRLRIAAIFGGYRVEDPDQQKHNDGYRRYGEKTGRPMDYYVVEVLPKCDGGVFLAFRDGKFGAGVYKEAETIAAAGKPIWEILPDLRILPLELAAARALTVEETRARIRDADKKLLPY
jgi:hypothetical protein